jgi:NADPH:quinone reductase-like Zn-dependent oxidoreductase
MGLKGVALPLPHVMGADLCGTLEGTGEKVLVDPGLSCGACERCQGNLEPECERFGILGLARWGGYAEKVAVPRTNCLPWPEGLAAPLAAAFPLVFTTAYHMLHARGGVKPGERVLVLAASGGVGTAAVQLAKAAGAKVVAVVGNEDKAFRVRALGADVVIDRSKEDVVSTAQEVDLVIDPVGGEILVQALGTLRKGGRLVTCAVTAGPTAILDVRDLFMRRLSVLGSYMGSRRDLEASLALLATGKVKAVVDTVFPLREAADAHRMLEAGKHFGKLVLVPG